MKKLKISALAVAILTVLLIPTNYVYAVEASEEIMEVPQDETARTIIAFGKSIAIIHADNSMEIIANNLSGRIDVMIDGIVTKGIGKIMIPAQSRAKIALEEDSFVVNGITEEDADTLKETVSDYFSQNMCIEDSTVIEKIIPQTVNVFITGQNGELLSTDGNPAPANIQASMQITTPDALYETFVDEMNEAIRQEQKIIQQAKEPEQNTTIVNEKEENNSTVTTEGCFHEWVLSSSKLTTIHYSENSCEACLTEPIYKCAKCGALWSQNYHEHGEEYCQYCGYNIHGKQSAEECPAGGEHDYVMSDKEYGTGSIGPLMSPNHTWCHTGKFPECTKCGIINVSDVSHGDIHIHGDEYCTYCGYNKNGEHR
ncbi:MAG: hypothetical protein NC314_13375 [Roseburia sp.]|nr:hypothetical protein [Roseburia sp.]MCM1243828.1 hypothetical protein [Roseburia sp.]